MYNNNHITILSSTHYTLLLLGDQISCWRNGTGCQLFAALIRIIWQLYTRTHWTCMNTTCQSNKICTKRCIKSAIRFLKVDGCIINDQMKVGKKWICVDNNMFAYFFSWFKSYIYIYIYIHIFTKIVSNYETVFCLSVLVNITGINQYNTWRTDLQIVGVMQ